MLKPSKKRKCKECRNPFTPYGTVVVCSFDCAVAYGKKTAAKLEARKTRNYWRPVADNLAEHVCECKKTEPKIVMDKGDFIYRHAK